MGGWFSCGEGWGPSHSSLCLECLPQDLHQSALRQWRHMQTLLRLKDEVMTSVGSTPVLYFSLCRATQPASYGYYRLHAPVAIPEITDANVN